MAHDGVIQVSDDLSGIDRRAVIVHEPEIAKLAQAVELDPLHGPVPDLVAALRDFRP